MKPAIGISEKNLQKSIGLLTTLLADEVLLYTKTRKFHWNVCGESFMELHKLFQEQYNTLEETIDEIAERISKLGGKTIGTLKEFLSESRLKEDAGKYPERNEMILQLLADHETIASEIRKYISKSEENKDAGTTDFITGILQQHEHISWTLRRYRP
jgi:starvation-inducible DNA-binding protein